MKLTKKIENGCLTLAVDDRLDTVTAHILGDAVEGISANVNNLVFDFTELKYIASAGIRIVLQAKQTMDSRSGKLSIRGANQQVHNAFVIVGLASFIDFI